MKKVLCISTCYMSAKKGKKMPVERYEDEYGDERDVYEIPETRVDEFLNTGNFELVKGPSN